MPLWCLHLGREYHIINASSVRKLLELAGAFRGFQAVKRFFKLANLSGLLGAVLLTSALAGLPPKQGDPSLYFPETGHTVRDPFVSFFNRTGGLAQHGFPITDDFVDPATGLLMQYFENSRFEWHPGNPDPYKVQLGLLGDQLGYRQPPIPIGQIPPANDPNCQYFNETGHTVCLRFRDYWLQNGGIDRYGYPIGEWTKDGDRIIQFFQRARLEWHPEKPADQRVQLTPLGRAYFQVAGLNPALLAPSPQSASLGQVRSLAARGAVMNSVAVSNGSQTGFVYVTDQLGHPIGGAAVTLVVHYPDGDQALTLPPTTAGGTTFVTFTIPSITAGTIVSVDYIIGYAGVFTETRASFMIWY